MLELVLELSAAQRAFAVKGDIVEAIRCQIRRDELFSELAMMERGQADVGALMELIEGISANDAETTILLTGALAQTGEKLKRLKSGTKAGNAYTAHQDL